ncbi:sigma-70 family RNA polymerase sigma factor [Streptomyces sp. TS71-3]|uniref:sigma-70 family RNA polymerase sigma factor n=1 Tax=Streptomyces sp. TS71-3 TaxID=2733862 RepID=UPI001B1E8366|nr:sigma-70 family RNA polymerase sigma factor [Streptomyces sp. TS71-3]GHJ34427.1 DNA-directed RNA polymerase sigma-70 factor [Streptomyces sp. TS71-3]
MGTGTGKGTGDGGSQAARDDLAVQDEDPATQDDDLAAQDDDLAAQDDDLAARFEESRPHLRAVAYRMLGSLSEAEDAVQEAWFRLSRTGAEGIANLPGWLTTVVGRICLDMLRTRLSRREEPLDVRVPDPVIEPLDAGPGDPEGAAVRTEAVGLALLVVLDTLGPAERLAYVLHDLFAVPFDAIAAIVDRSPAATRQLASRARRRIQAAGPEPESDPGRQRSIVDAFLAASRSGDFDALLALLDPDVELRADAGPGGASQLIRGARNVARQAFTFRRLAADVHPVLVAGTPGLLATPGGHPVSVMGFTVRGGRITELIIIADPERLGRLGVRGDQFPTN